MAATTYAISVNEETARRFEAAAAAQGLEPSEVLCRLVREFAQAGGFADDASKEVAETNALQQQASEWLSLRAAHERQRLQDSELVSDGQTQTDPETQPHDSNPGKPSLPWEDPNDPALPWQQESPAPAPKLPWQD